MANAAWAFVRPMEITKGALAAVQAQNAEDANALKLQDAQDALDYNRQIRPLQMQSQQEALAYNQELRPLQLQSMKDIAAYNQALRPLQVQGSAQTAALNTQTYEAANIANTVKNALMIPQMPGESELDLYKNKLAIAQSLAGPAQAQALIQVQQEGSRLALISGQRGDMATAQQLLEMVSPGPTPTNLAALEPQKQLAWLTNNVLGSQQPKSIDTTMFKHQTPSGDAILKTTMDEANRKSPITEAKIQEGFIDYLKESAKTGITAMPYEQYRKAIVGNTAAAPNSVRGIPNPVGASGVPYK